MSEKKKYQFDNIEGAGRFLRCPECGELLMPQDIESWSVCPYCNAQIEPSPEVEDFAIEPLVRQWINHISH